MAPEITYRTYRKGDEGKLVPFLTSIFPNWPPNAPKQSPMKFWRWRYQENPYENNIVIIAEHDNKLIGCSHSFVIKVKIGEKIRKCHIAGDFAVHPDFRQMGISRKLTETKKIVQRETGTFASLNYTTNPIIIQNAEKEGRPRFPQQIIRMLHIKDTRLHDEKRKMGLIKRIGYEAISSYQRKINGPRFKFDSYGYSIKEIDEFKEANQLWDSIKDHYKYIMVRDNEFLNWRYNSKMGYKIIKIEKYDLMIGFCVCKISGDSEYPVGIIVDFLVNPNIKDASSILLEETIRFFDESHVNICETWLVSGHPYVNVFKKRGFVQTKNSVSLHFSPKTDEPVFDEIHDFSPHRLIFSYGDSDLH